LGISLEMLTSYRIDGSLGQVGLIIAGRTWDISIAISRPDELHIGSGHMIGKNDVDCIYAIRSDGWTTTIFLDYALKRASEGVEAI